LSVDVFAGFTDDEPDILVTPHSETLAGFESWRTTLWGAERVRALGAVFFPVLAADDLYVWPGQVEAFQKECKRLRANLEVVAVDVDPGNPGSAYGVLVDGRIELRKPEDTDGIHADSLRAAGQR
jgi:hypothetical protein